MKKYYYSKKTQKGFKMYTLNVYLLSDMIINNGDAVIWVASPIH
jgi:hypothetical protein